MATRMTFEICAARHRIMDARVKPGHDAEHVARLCRGETWSRIN
jgi:hypothetical protein